MHIYCLQGRFLFLLCAILLSCAVYGITREASEFPHPIDVVYLWVNGSDANWRSIKKFHQELYGDADGHVFDSLTDNRYEDNDELKYSLRSIWQFAPFIHHIYIVTMDQTPDWLAEHPKISIVDHTQIFLNQDFLPTFNSHALESNLHRIPGLQEHFIYFNDDVFLSLPVTPFDFFTGKGDVLVLFEAALSPSGPSVGNETSYRLAWRNTNALLDKLYKEENRYRLCHAPFALMKSYIEETERNIPDVFWANSSHKFRCSKDYNITNGLLQYDWLYKGKVFKGTITSKMVTLRNDDRFTQTAHNISALEKKRPHTFCLQDNMKKDCERTKLFVRKFLERMYPEPAPWEK